MLDPLSPNMFQYCFAAPSPRAAVGSSTTAPTTAAAPAPGRQFADRMRDAIQQTSTAHVLLVRDWDSPRDSRRAAQIVGQARDVITTALELPVDGAARYHAVDGIGWLDMSSRLLARPHRTAPVSAAPPLAEAMMSMLRTGVASDPLRTP